MTPRSLKSVFRGGEDFRPSWREWNFRFSESLDRSCEEGTGTPYGRAASAFAPDPPRATGVGPVFLGFCPFLGGYFWMGLFSPFFFPCFWDRTSLSMYLPDTPTMSHPPRSPRCNTRIHFWPLWFCFLLRIHASRSLFFLSALVSDLLPRRLFDGFC